jgi:hypothetical protein
MLYLLILLLLLLLAIVGLWPGGRSVRIPLWSVFVVVTIRAFFLLLQVLTMLLVLRAVLVLILKKWRRAPTFHSMLVLVSYQLWHANTDLLHELGRVRDDIFHVCVSPFRCRWRNRRG